MGLTNGSLSISLLGLEIVEGMVGLLFLYVFYSLVFGPCISVVYIMPLSLYKIFSVKKKKVATYIKAERNQNYTN